MWNNRTKVSHSHALVSIITTDDDQHVSQILDREDNTRSCDVSIIGLCTNDNYKYAKDALDAEHANKLKEILYIGLDGPEPHWYWLLNPDHPPVPQLWLWYNPMSKVVEKNPFELLDDPTVNAQSLNHYVHVPVNPLRPLP